MEAIKKSRNSDAVIAALEQISTIASSGEGNLLEAAIIAARERATVGEISDAMAKIFGRYEGTSVSVTGVYGAHYKNTEFDEVVVLTDNFAQEYGRRPRMYVAKLGQDGHDRGAHVIATGFADLGFDVDIGPLFQTPEEAALMAIDSDVHVVGVSSQAAGHKTLIPLLIQELHKQQADDIIVVAGGVIPPKDYDFLYENGVKEIFGPGTNIVEAAKKIISRIREAHPDPLSL